MARIIDGLPLDEAGLALWKLMTERPEVPEKLGYRIWLELTLCGRPRVSAVGARQEHRFARVGHSAPITLRRLRFCGSDGRPCMGSCSLPNSRLDGRVWGVNVRSFVSPAVRRFLLANTTAAILACRRLSKLANQTFLPALCCLAHDLGAPALIQTPGPLLR